MNMRHLLNIMESAPIPNGYRLGRSLLNRKGISADVIYMKDPYEEYIIRFYNNGVHLVNKDYCTDDLNEVEDVLRGNIKSPLAP